MKDQEDDEQAVVVTEISPEALYRQDKASVDIQIATAHQYPRNVLNATNDAIAIVQLNIETAEACRYALKRGTDKKTGKAKIISGPSVHLAKILAQCWGNMRLQAKVVDIDRKNKHITSQATAWDLQSNLAIQIEVKRSIAGKEGIFSDDMITVTGNAANSISLRNAIFAIVPRGLVDKVLNAANSFVIGDISDETKLIARRKQVVETLRDTYKVTEQEIVEAVGRTAITHIDKDDILTLISIGTGIKDGDTTVDQAFRKKKEAPPAIALEEVQVALELNKGKLTTKEVADIQRIIDSKEENSYAKAMKKLLA